MPNANMGKHVNEINATHTTAVASQQVFSCKAGVQRDCNAFSHTLSQRFEAAFLLVGKPTKQDLVQTCDAGQCMTVHIPCS